MIVGKKADLVKKILFVLSYFIRCSDILETVDVGCLETFLEKLDFIVESPSGSAKTLPACTPNDEENRLLTSSPTPVSTGGNQFKFESTDYNSLPLDSLLSNRKSGDCLGSGDGPQESCVKKGDNSGLAQTCDMCRRNMENKVGKSVFYVNNEKCSCEHSTESVKHLSVSSLNADRKSEIQRKKESLKLGIKLPRETSHTETATETEACKLSTVDIVEDTRIERVGLGKKSVNIVKEPIVIGEKVKVPGYDIKIPNNVNKVLTLEEIRTLFRNKGSNSMFDEYFEDGSEAKTIDDMDEKDLQKLRERIRGLGRETQTSEADQLKTPSLPDLTPCGRQDTEQEERLRLGSLDQTYSKGRKSSLSRQISETSGKPSKYAPGRCRSVLSS